MKRIAFIFLLLSCTLAYSASINIHIGIKALPVPIPPGLGPVTGRAPTVYDTASLGWKVNDLWLYSGSVYLATSVNAGGATWDLQTLSANPIDNVSATPLAAWCLIKCKSTYAGSAIQLTRDSDNTTLDIGFTGNDIDATTADTFCGSANCYCTKIYDQSGGANDLIQATLTNAPQWKAATIATGSTTGYSVGTKRACSLNSILHTSPTFTAVLYPPKYMVASSLVWTQGRSAWAMAGQMQTTRDTQTWFASSDELEGVFNAYVISLTSGGMTPFGVLSGRCATLMMTSPAVHVFRWSTANTLTCWANNSTSGNSTALHGNSKTGFMIGGTDAGFRGVYNFVAMIGYGDALSNTNATNLRASLSLSADIQFQSRDFQFIIGDSGSSGAMSLQASSWPKVAAVSTVRPTTVYNGAVLGRTLVSSINDLISNGWLFQYLNQQTTADNLIFTVEAGLNDLRAGSTNADIEANFKSLTVSLKASSPRASVIISTYPLQCANFNNKAWLAQTQDLQDWTIANYNVAQPTGIGATGLFNPWADPTVGPDSYVFSAFADLQYSGDCGHPTDLTNTFMAPWGIIPLNSILNSYP